MWGYRQKINLGGKVFEVPYYLDTLIAMVGMCSVYLPMFNVEHLGYSVRLISPISIIQGASIYSFSALCFGWLMVIVHIIALFSALLKLADPIRKVIAFYTSLTGIMCTLLTYFYIVEKYNIYYSGEAVIGLREGSFLYVGSFCLTMSILLLQGATLNVNDIVVGFKQLKERLSDILGNMVKRACPYCGEKNIRHKNFCCQCGEYLPFTDKIKCPICYMVCTGDLDFCPTCGFIYPPDTPIIDYLYVEDLRVPWEVHYNRQRDNSEKYRL